jgi:hypothetical protein
MFYIGPSLNSTKCWNGYYINFFLIKPGLIKKELEMKQLITNQQET